MKHVLAAALALLLGVVPARAFSGPQQIGSTQSKVSVTSTKAFVQALPAAQGRGSCLIQYTGTATGFVFFGPAAPGDTTSSFALGPKQTISCGSNGLVAADAVWLTGTAGDAFVVLVQ